MGININKQKIIIMKKNNLIIKISLITLLLSMNLFSTAQIKVDRVEPPFWWIGMNDKHLQLLIYGDNISETDVITEKEDIQIKRIIEVENPNYLFLDLEIDEDADQGIYNIIFKQDTNIYKHKYLLKRRRHGSSERKGFSSSDVIYLLMPDRFSNGDPANDDIHGMLEKADRSNPDGRHGGDLKGIENHLDYFKKLGVTTIWINPVFENNMPEYSYHGYSITDFYKIDPRFGTNKKYKDLVQKCHENNLKVIMDMVFNHCGSYHWWMDDLPSEDWIHQFDEFTQTNFRAGTITDPHASDYDRKKMTDGWFVKTMPDLNQDNELMANYLIQNSIWWIEYANLNGIRMDTYPYADKEFMAEWMAGINEEYPDFNVVGESWLSSAPMVAYWQDNSNVKDDYKSNLNTVFDFPLYYTIDKAFTEPNTWDKGIVRLYETLSHDFLYNNTNNLVIFADNHDTDRFFTTIEEDPDDYKLAIAFLMTTRGIPLIYYGTEIGMTGYEHKGHGDIRKDFPGGWPKDKESAFNAPDRDDLQNEMFSYLQKLLKWRQNKDVIHTGKLKHFIPENGVYVYFRYNDEDTVMVIINNSDKSQKINAERYAECLEGYYRGNEIISGSQITDLENISIPEKSAIIIELIK